MLRFDNDNHKHKKKKKKKKHIRKLKGYLEYLDPHFQKKTREKKEDSSPPGSYFCEQYGSQGSKQPCEGSAARAGEGERRSALPAAEGRTGKQPGACRTPFHPHTHCYVKQLQVLVSLKLCFISWLLNSLHQ